MLVGDAQQLGAVGRRLPRLFPQVHGLHHGHQHFPHPGLVHFLADDLFHLAQHPQPAGKPGKGFRGQLAHQAGTEHQPMADDDGIRGGFLDGGEQVLGGAVADVFVRWFQEAPFYGSVAVTSCVS